MNEKQVGVIPLGIYYICPHCKQQIRTDYHCNYCPDCGDKLVWENVNEFNEIKSNNCPNEDTDGYCKYYGEQCHGSKNCEYVKECHFLREYTGRLTSSEKRKLLSTKDYIY